MIFLDTSFLYPLFNVEDDDHARVREVFESLRGRRLDELLVTTSHVIFETITLIRLGQRQGRPDSAARHREAVYAGERLLAGKLARIVWPTEGDARAAFEYLAQHEDKEYSFTDCLSFVVMDALGITEEWAVDSDFTHRFVVKPGPLR